MAKIIKCKSCGKDMAVTAKRCPSCGGRNHQRTLANLIILVLLIFVVVAIFNNLDGSDSTPAEKTYVKVGEIFSTKKVDFTVISIDKKNRVGDEFFFEKPSEGGVYVAVYYQYKNISE